MARWEPELSRSKAYKREIPIVQGRVFSRSYLLFQIRTVHVSISTIPSVITRLHDPCRDQPQSRGKCQRDSYRAPRNRVRYKRRSGTDGPKGIKILRNFYNCGESTDRGQDNKASPH